MGARWAWYAKCPDGHVYSGFSGGADDCYECGKPPVIGIDCPHHWLADTVEVFDGPFGTAVRSVDPCNCREELSKPVRFE